MQSAFTTSELLKAFFRLGTARSAYGHIHHFHLCGEEDSDWGPGRAGDAGGDDTGGGAEGGADATAAAAIPASPTRPVRKLSGKVSHGDFRCCKCLLGLQLNCTDEGADPDNCHHVWGHISNEPNMVLVMCDRCGRILSGDISLDNTVMKPDPETGFAPLKLMLMCCGQDNTPAIFRTLKFICMDILTDVLTHGAASDMLSLDPTEERMASLVMDTSGTALLYAVGYEDTVADDGTARISIKELTPEVEAVIRRGRRDLGLLADQLRSALERRVEAGRDDDYDKAVTPEDVAWCPSFPAGDYAVAAIAKGGDIEALAVEGGEGVSSPADIMAARMAAARASGVSGGSAAEDLIRAALAGRGGIGGGIGGAYDVPSSGGIGGLDADADAVDAAPSSVAAAPRRGHKPVPLSRHPSGYETTMSPIGKEEEDPITDG
eukprot:CAMPEP_0203832450 /NCGR_PEP_ID=MMETSP0115-20131106/70803_1 /ASSEMBLY_ACC=CAM_ASM_000227 /TAXON_ID=33651 /ORGANISM="Bicosoecid sp, Strain ms1" /LENGTH=433 /DNA_ID=CAMNT_0050741519 /DNA_START=203 /DNA_END=1501 /DNA_ORIENTATION=-